MSPRVCLSGRAVIGRLLRLSEPTLPINNQRTGYSEHQTGIELDIGATNGACPPPQYRLVETPAATCAAGNVFRFGFILRYQPGHNKVAASMVPDTRKMLTCRFPAVGLSAVI
ncbi:MAG: M15 family metallopeptidase [Acidobacteria bacterium]|nr:M15 family metallopeptidase [Acidobacteriota bacterium]